jgi:hypothetical protein
MTAYSGIDIDAVHAQLLACPGSTAADLAFSLVAEVKFLRAQVDDYRMMIDGLETAAHEERAAVVAWLRHCDKLCRDLDGRETPVRGLYRLSADRIERGEHRREEKP